MELFDNDLHSFHDELVKGINLNEEGDRAEIIILSDDYSREWTIILEELDLLKIDNFRQGNIISYIESYDWTEVPMEFIAPFLDMDVESFMQSKYYSVYQKSIAEDKLFLFRIIPAYGCVLYALCKHAYVVCK